MKYISYSVLASALLMSGVSHATNTITFTGSITDVTCDVKLVDAAGKVLGVDGSGTVALIPVPATELSGAGSTAQQTQFSIVASGCTLGTPAKTKMAAYFTSSHADNLGYLDNTVGTGAATKVQFELLDSKLNQIKVNDPAQSTGIVTTDIVAAGDTVMDYYVQYYSAAGGATSGDVSSTVDYELVYP
ncbi:fimbrial protein [Citrobacter amalonaticus]|uniref:fimbrial protein n=1 Tax=Citrobacter amalonaticus TaxID=35703 RepID=UPI00255A998B|nr:fimbrial protein [Citrobacter amalonaticus]MDL4618718.1 fimbrial protein [Citrobacter amalonaticus]MDL4622816.1 fimbrial protein [Citrobacter amalonaticus]